ncbi:dienelactone hydrolase family protein [Blastopirellula marina]|uniref:Dienelactone hydrolase family protein n=1 Tax=Blastopirellula marina TaxID=124 RepID=A0A2S8F5X9_9BACT|nr:MULTISPECIES: dienelactone hydrolase family protein [Pirellulaceae]PQO27566.1 dienelactone hydrolase family protein [Blastopirellula marina]RCS48103.1 dienelactone hydrolase family protein [Bremerella cremea]
MRCLALSLAILALTTSIANAEVKTKVIQYQVGDKTFDGYLAYDDAVEGPRPGVVVFHEWWGLNDYAKKRTEMLAELGYVAFAADMYGDGKFVEHPKDAGQMAGTVRANVDQWQKRAVAALDVLKKQPQCNAAKIAAIGYCFGGSTALQLGYTGADIDAIATFHAALPTPSAEQAKAIKAKVLVCNGADDSFVSQDSINAFQEKLKDANVDLNFVAFPGAVHSFTVEDAGKHGNPGMQYNKEADEKSWTLLLELLKSELGTGK